MKKEVIRKVAVVAASLALVMGMSAVSFAAGSSNPSNPTESGTITIEKNLKVTNPTLASVDGPGATFSYAVAPATPAANNGGTTITDGTHTGTVHAGPANGVTLSASSIAYPIGTAVDASASGADNVKSITATADISKFERPGIYRYSLTETAALGDCEADNTDGTRYIDVYVVNGASGLEFSGMVMHDGTTSDGAPAEKKTFDDATFETVNVTLKKEVLGNMGDRANQFPFATTVSDHGRYYYAKKAAAPTAVTADKTASGSAVNTTLANDEMYYISGVSKSATVAYTETNNTQDTYQTAITGATGISNAASSAVTAGSTKAMAATDVDDAAAVVFQNTLDSVSPTGVILRFGPYLGMIVIAAVFIAMRKKAASQK